MARRERGPVRCADLFPRRRPSSPTTLYSVAGLYAAGTAGVFASADAAATWTRTALVPTPDVVAVDPTSAATVYVGTAMGVFKTTDGGAHWISTSSGLPPAESGFPCGPNYVSALTIDPTTPNTLYAGVFCVAIDIQSFAEVFKSTDSGANWVEADAGLRAGPALTLTVDPITPTTIYAASLVGIGKSIDAGATWEMLKAAPSSVQALAIHPAVTTTLYVGASAGVFKSTDGGATWQPMNIGLTERTGQIPNVTALAFDPANSSTLLAGTANNGVFILQQGSACIGDCNDDGVVTINELVAGVAIDLGFEPVGVCPAIICSAHLGTDISCIVSAVNNALDGCEMGGVTPTPNATPATPTSVETQTIAVETGSPTPTRMPTCTITSTGTRPPSPTPCGPGEVLACTPLPTPLIRPTRCDGSRPTDIVYLCECQECPACPDGEILDCPPGTACTCACAPPTPSRTLTATPTPTPTPVRDCNGAPPYAPCIAGCGQGVCYGTVCSAIECTPSVTGTISPTPTPTPPFGRCRDSSQCQQSGGRCLAPGEFPGCGPTAAPVPTRGRCQADSDCRSRGDIFICTRVDPRTCEFGLACVAGCRTDGDCAVGEACDPTHRCVPRPCASDVDCPLLFACPDLPEGQRGCYRRTCVTDPDCLGGFCVTGSCYDQLGACATPPA